MIGINFAFNLEAKIAKMINEDLIDPKSISYPIFIRRNFSERPASWACTYDLIHTNDKEDWFEDFVISNYKNSGVGDTIDEALLNAITKLCANYNLKIKGFNC